jgi:hypothetical protein
MLESNHSFFIIKYNPCSYLQLRLYHPTKLNIEFIMNDRQGKKKKKKKKKKNTRIGSIKCWSYHCQLSKIPL